MADNQDKKPVEVGQIYEAKAGTPQSSNKFKTLRIHAEFKDPENPQLENLWTAQVMNAEGEWAFDSELDLIFAQMLETTYVLHFDPMRSNSSRLDDIDD